MKELLIVENTKKCAEFNNRLKEFSALYDIVKNERNKYVNLIQVSSSSGDCSSGSSSSFGGGGGGGGSSGCGRIRSSSGGNRSGNIW